MYLSAATATGSNLLDGMMFPETVCACIEGWLRTAARGIDRGRLCRVVAGLAVVVAGS